MKSLKLITVVLTVFPLMATAAATDYRAQAHALVAQMTLEEKAALCSGRDLWSTKPIERLDIPSIFLTDGPHGVRRAVSGDLVNNRPATCFPTAPALGATWSNDLVQEIGVALGQESQALGIQILLGPGVNMKRCPLGGRNFEYLSEDPVLAGRLAASWINGVQSQGVGASLKHFAANNQENERWFGSSVVDERTLHEIYLTAFEIAVKDAQPWTVMCSYNKLNGVFASENPVLLTDILRRSWSFKGVVVSDWGAVDNRVAGIRAGLNLEMPSSGGINDRRIVAAVIAGELNISALDAVVIDLLELTLRAHAAAQPGATFDAAAHHALARRAAGEAIVLLKNEKVLPFDPARSGTIAVIGDLAKHPRYQGSGSSRVTPLKLDNAFDELETIVGAEHLRYAAGCDGEGMTSDALLGEAREIARKSDRAILFVGLPDSYESEGFDRKGLDLPSGYNRLVDAVAAVQPNTTVVLLNGSAIAMPWAGRVQAIVEAYLGGEAGGGAIADVLTGRVNPSGKLAETFPVRIEDTPTYPNFPGRDGQALYGEGLFIGYRYYDAKKIAPLYPFGFGLSYTTFAYMAVKADAPAVKAADGATIHVTVKNTGKRAGAEVVQLYVREVGAPVVRPGKELKHFARVTLAAGEEKTVTFALNARDFAWYDAALHDWVVDTGTFEVLVGGSSRDLPLRQTLTVEGLPRGYPKLTRFSSLADLAAHPRGRPIYDQLMKSMLDAAAKSAPAKPSTSEEQATAKRALDTMTMFMREQPLCKLVMVSQGQFSEETMQGILQAVNQ
jgi:beta-glucosidase